MPHMIYVPAFRTTTARLVTETEFINYKLSPSPTIFLEGSSDFRATTFRVKSSEQLSASIVVCVYLFVLGTMIEITKIGYVGPS
jgi:hypothetical protein